MDDVVSESELLRASLAGSKEAFGVVVKRYQSLVCALAYSATGDIGKSEELAQETFLRVWRSLPQLEDLGHFRAWLCTIARNLISQSIRQRPRDVIHAADSLGAAETLSAVTPDPGQAAMDKELQEIVWAAVRRVPQKYREPLVLFYREQQSVSRVAAYLGLSEETVRQRLCRGRQLIKAEVASLVEDTLARSGPGKTFAIAVVAALPAILTPTAGAAVTGIVAKGTPAAKTVMAAGLSGAILGPIFGLLGGLLGAWCSIRNTNSPRERRFVIRMTILVWLLLFALVGLPMTLALAGVISRAAFWSWATAFFVLLLPLILWGNAHQKRIQVEEGSYRPREYSARRMTRPGIYASFGGGIFGGTAWLLIMAWLAKDWMSFSAILACDILVFLAVSEICVRKPQRYWSVAVVLVGALMAVTLTAVNLRWIAWMHAYRQSTAYDPMNDVSLTTINLVVLGAFIALFSVFATRYVRHKAKRKDSLPKDPKSG
jgi:RNA polymerase sigma factor (sigma-70 family)